MYGRVLRAPIEDIPAYLFENFMPLFCAIFRAEAEIAEPPTCVSVSTTVTSRGLSAADVDRSHKYITWELTTFVQSRLELERQAAGYCHCS